MATLSIEVGRFTAHFELAVQPGVDGGIADAYMEYQFRQMIDLLAVDPNNAALRAEMERLQQFLDQGDPLVEFMVVSSLGLIGPSIDQFSDDFCIPNAVMERYLSDAIGGLTYGGVVPTTGSAVLGRIEEYAVRDGYATASGEPACDIDVDDGEVECPIVNGVETCIIHPVFLDLDGNGYISNPNRVMYDVFGDETYYSIAWPGPSDGILVFDLNEDGTFGVGDNLVTRPEEIIFTNWLEGGSSDLLSIANAVDANGNKIFDTNSNGLIDAGDVYFSSFKVWTDSDQDGVVDAGELQSLSEMGVEAINLSYNETEDCGCGGSNSGIEVLGFADAVVNGVLAVDYVVDAGIDIDPVGYSIFSDGSNLSIATTNGASYSFWFAALAGTQNYIYTSGDDNIIVGDGLDNYFDGSLAQHSMTFFVESGSDTVIGGLGDDVIYLTGDFHSTAINIHGGSGTDTGIFLYATADFDVLLLNLSIEVWLDGSGSSRVSGLGGLTSVSIYGAAGNDTLIGSDHNDSLLGGEGDDILDGGNGNDLISDGGGNDTISCGAGDDTIIYTSGQDVIMGDVSNEGTDTLDLRRFNADQVQFSVSGSDVVITTPDGTIVLESQILHDLGSAYSNIEVVLFNDMIFDETDIRSRAITDQMTSADDSIFGTAFSDDISGLEGNDTIYGAAGDDWLYGGAGDDLLEGGAGADVMAGGEGDDSYVVDSAADIVVEDSDEGIDTVYSSVGYSLGNEIENLTLTGSAAVSAAGNTLDNTLVGNSAANLLEGFEGNDSIYGDDGADTLDGGIGADLMAGGAGDDSYFVDNSADVIVEIASEGRDTVHSTVTFTLSSEVENLTLSGSGVTPHSPSKSLISLS